MEIKNAIILKTTLTPVNNNTGFIFNIQGDNWNSEYSGIIPNIDSINAIIFSLGVDAWERISGCPIRVKIAENGQITNIGNFVQDRWLINEEVSEPENVNEEDKSDTNE